MKNSFHSRPALCVGIGLLFFLFAWITAVFAHVRLLPLCFGALGLLSIAVGIYYAVFRIEYVRGRFIAHPGPRDYAVTDIGAWTIREDPDEVPGRMRHLEVRFDRWYRRYFVFEADITPPVFDEIVSTLRGSKRPNQSPQTTRAFGPRV